MVAAMYDACIDDLYLKNYAKWKNNTSSFPVKDRSLTWNSIKVCSEENLKTFKKNKKKELAALSNMAGLFGLTHAGEMAADETDTKAWVLRLKESVLVLFRELSFPLHTQETSYHFNASFLHRLQPWVHFSDVLIKLPWVAALVWHWQFM